MKYQYLDEKGQHLHTLDTGSGAQPLYGTSTILKILNKPLAFWAAGKALEPFGWRNTKYVSSDDLQTAASEGQEKVENMSVEEYAKFLQECYRAHDTEKKQKAETGTDMHALLSDYILQSIKYTKGVPLKAYKTESKEVKSFQDWAIRNVDTFLWSEGNTFSKKLWVGGIVDAGAKMKNGNKAILDFKSAKEAYYSHMVQVAGYSLQVEEKGILTNEGKVVLDPMEIKELIVLPFGKLSLEVRIVQNVKGFQEAFKGCVVNYILDQAFQK